MVIFSLFNGFTMKNKYLKFFFKIIWDAAFSMPKHNAFEMSGYLSFLTFIAIFPCTIFLAKLASVFDYFLIDYIKQNNINNFLVKAFNNIQNLPIKNLQAEITQILKGPPKSIVWYAIFGLIWTSSSTIEGLRVILHRAYNIHSKKNYIFNRLFSVLQFIIISIATIIIISFLQIILPLIFKYGLDLESYLISGSDSYLSKIFNFFQYILNIIILITYVIWIHFSLSGYRKKYHLKNFIVGASITVLLWLVSTEILQFYFAKFLQFNIIYGGLANIISILLFFYVSFLCFVFGAEFNYIYNDRIKEM